MDSSVRDRLTLAPNWQSTSPTEYFLNGQSWWYEYLPARYNKGRMVIPPGVRLSVAIPHEFERSVLVVREDRWDRAAKSLGLSHEFQTGAPDVDAEMMLSGDLGNDLPMFFQTPATQVALGKLFERGFDRVEFFGQRIRATCRPWMMDLEDQAPPQDFIDAVGALFKLSGGLALLPDASPSAGARFHHALASPSPAVWAGVGILVSVLLILLMNAMTFISGMEVLMHVGGWALAAGATAVMLFAVVCGRFAFRGRTIAALTFAAFAIASSFTLLTLTRLNESLDPSPAVEHTELVTSKRISGSKSRSYVISMPSWRPGHQFENFTISSSVWQDVRPGASQYLVHSRAGYFGIEWLQDQRVIP